MMRGLLTSTITAGARDTQAGDGRGFVWVRGRMAQVVLVCSGWAEMVGSFGKNACWRVAGVGAGLEGGLHAGFIVAWRRGEAGGKVFVFSEK